MLAILILALGIGVNVAIFSALEALVINPLPFPHADRLVAVYEDSAWLGYRKNTPAPANFQDWSREAKSFEYLAATTFCRAVLTGDGVPEEVGCRNVTANTWPMLGVKPLLGRWFTREEDHPQPDVGLIGEGLWVRRFGGDAGIIGRAIQINGRAVRIVGVMPQWFRFGADRELWMPTGFSEKDLARRGSHFLTCYGRLKPGISVGQASAELRAIQTRLNRQYPGDTDPRMGAWAEPLRDALVGDTRIELWILMGAAAMVLLIACANVANLLLARATSRQRELAVRSALGASSARLLGQVFSETVLLTGTGGLAGFGCALASKRLLENFIPEALKGSVTIGLDGRVLAFTLLASFAAAILASATPILHVLRAPLMTLLREDSRTGSSRGTVRLRGILVMAEVALTVALLAGAGLMIRSLTAIWHTAIGFRPENLMTVRVSLPAKKYSDNQKRFLFYDRALEKIRALPGVTAADFASTPPFFSIGNSQGFAIEGRTPPDTWEPSDMLTRVATADYLRTIGAAMVAGRMFTDADREHAQDVAIVNESFGHVFFPNQPVVGRRLSLNDRTGGQRRWRTIVGVVKEVKERGYDYAPKPVTYVTVRQIDDWFASQLVFRARGVPPETLLNPIRRAIQEIDPDQPLGVARTFDEILALDQANRRQEMFLLAAFAGLALIMASLGIYAILAYMVELRRQEIGVRLALGASRGAVLRLVIVDGMKLAACGGIIGVGAALAGARLLEHSLYGVKSFDPVTFLTISGVLAVIAFLACWVPARRAAATSPMIALRP